MLVRGLGLNQVIFIILMKNALDLKYSKDLIEHIDIAYILCV